MENIKKRRTKFNASIIWISIISILFLVVGLLVNFVFLKETELSKFILILCSSISILFSIISVIFSIALFFNLKEDKKRLNWSKENKKEKYVVKSHNSNIKVSQIDQPKSNHISNELNNASEEKNKVFTLPYKEENIYKADVQVIELHTPNNVSENNEGQKSEIFSPLVNDKQEENKTIIPIIEQQKFIPDANNPFINFPKNVVIEQKETISPVVKIPSVDLKQKENTTSFQTSNINRTMSYPMPTSTSSNFPKKPLEPIVKCDAVSSSRPKPHFIAVSRPLPKTFPSTFNAKNISLPPKNFVPPQGVSKLSTESNVSTFTRINIPANNSSTNNLENSSLFSNKFKN